MICIRLNLSSMALAVLVALAAPAQAQAQRSATLPGQADAWTRLAAETGQAAEVAVNPATGAARFVRLAPAGKGLAPSSRARALTVATQKASSAQFLRDYGSLFGIRDAASELSEARVEKDAQGGSHLSHKQLYRGVPVFGAVLKTHFSASGELSVVNGSFIPGIAVDPQPGRTAEQAAVVALALVRSELGQPEAQLATQATLMIYRTGLAKGVAGGNHLAWQVEVGNRVDVRDFVFVDAHSGKVIDKIAGIHHAKNRRAYDAVGRGQAAAYPSLPFWVEGQAFPTGRTEADNVLAATSDIHDLFRIAFGRDSFNGAGATMDAIFNGGSGPVATCPNAYWNGDYAFFCSGTAADDVIAHEWGHAYTEFSHNLIYAYQPGALNEAYSDIWGETVDLLNGRGTDTPDALRIQGNCSSATPRRTGFGVDSSVRWLASEDATAFGGAIRDMANPGCYGDPGKVSDANYVCTADDEGGVHSNSGVPNHAYALLVDGGSYNGQTIFSIGLTKAAHIYYRAQSVYQVPASGFADHADAIEQSCADLTGVNLAHLKTGAPSGEVISASDCAQVAKAALAVELRTPPLRCDHSFVLAKSPPALCAAGTPASLMADGFDGGKRKGVSWLVSHLGSKPSFTPRDFGVVSKLPSGRAGYGLFATNQAGGNCGRTGPDESGVMRLDGPEITIPAATTSLRLAFDHWVFTEALYDGGNVKISVNGGAFQVVKAVDFVYNPYNGTLSDGPMKGQPAFMGSDKFVGKVEEGSWGRSIVNLSPYAKAGDRVRLRFEFGNDGCDGKVGWYLDDVNLYRCQP